MQIDLTDFPPGVNQNPVAESPAAVALAAALGMLEAYNVCLERILARFAEASL